MNKALIAFGSTSFPQGALKFLKELNKLRPMMVAGTFLPQFDMAHLWLYADPLTGFSYLPEIEEESVVNNNMEQFSSVCKEAGIKFSIHHDTDGLTASLLQGETRFADYLVIDSERFYEYMGTGASNPTLTDSLHQAECPVVVVPETFEFPKRNILAFDGSESSLFAIKQFAHLFPELAANETVMVYASREKTKTFPSVGLVKEWAEQHFGNVSFINLETDARKGFLNWVNNHQDAIVVSGSFGRTPASEFFRKSFIADLITQHRFPVFIAHR